MSNRATQRETLPRSFFERLLEKIDHSVLIEITLLEMGSVPIAHLQLPGGLRFGGIDAGAAQPPQMFFPQLGIYDEEGSVTAREPLPEEGKQHPVFFVQIVKESTDVTRLKKMRTGASNGSSSGFHNEFCCTETGRCVRPLRYTRAPAAFCRRPPSVTGLPSFP
ncbi:MAG TPA: hypothetical protein VFX20_02975 [Steroidobacteraceae bacterium]|nr:hypothetical protein [Steroidobacteraceae bacterium]